MKNLLHIPQSSRQINRLNEGELDFARRERLKEIRMWSIIVELTLYTIFIILITVITFSHRDRNSFHQVQHLRNSLFNSRQIGNDYSRVTIIMII